MFEVYKIDGKETPDGKQFSLLPGNYQVSIRYEPEYSNPQVYKKGYARYKVLYLSAQAGRIYVVKGDVDQNADVSWDRLRLWDVYIIDRKTKERVSREER